MLTNKKKILLIDDEEDFCFFVKNNLTTSGDFSVSYATNPNEGIRIARDEVPDLILLDILMPGKDGFKVLKILKKNIRTTSIPVIMLTAVADDSAKLKASYLYNEDYIVKPVNFEKLSAKINALLERRKAIRA